MMEPAFEGDAKWKWILHSGWHGLCPRCGKGAMFKSWLQITDRCESCGLGYEWASPDDGPAFFSLCFVAFPLTFLGVWFQVAFEPPMWVHMLTTIPLMVIGCVLPLRPLKGWLVASQFANNAQEAGTAELWAKLNKTAAKKSESDEPPVDS
ncbi:MAG: DUF983 domain-containing protein [Sphingomonadales bacterium]|jgi:uncharacterized protein (DUF983 family)|nr:MAG: DUF983 domain-containing protein [Sphingomonadales bacterium]